MCVHRQSADTAVEVHRYWTPSRLIIAARDLCVLGHAAVLGDGSLVLGARSVRFRHPSAEEGSAHTRALLHCGGFVVQATEAGRALPMDAAADYEAAVRALCAARECRLTFVARCDLRGAVPAPLRAKLLERQPMMLRHVRAIATRQQRSARAAAAEDTAQRSEELQAKLRSLSLYPQLSCPHDYQRAP